MNTRDITTLTDAELQAESDALTRECIAAWHRKRDAQEVWEALSERKADVTIELAKRYNGVKQAVERG
jgi:hypothetical protein